MSLIENALCEEYNAQVMVGKKGQIIFNCRNRNNDIKVFSFSFFFG